jgi:hypothetical protein
MKRSGGLGGGEFDEGDNAHAVCRDDDIVIDWRTGMYHDSLKQVLIDRRKSRSRVRIKNQLILSVRNSMERRNSGTDFTEIQIIPEDA